MTHELMQAHLADLALDLGCLLVQPSPDTAGMMFVEFGWVEGPTVVDGFDYNRGMYRNAESRFLTNLHELGHFAHGHTQGRPISFYHGSPNLQYEVYERFRNENSLQWYFQNGVLRSEAEAWEWALDNLPYPESELEEATRRFMSDRCIGSYFAHAERVGFETPGQLLYNGDRAYVQFAYGTPDQYFHSVRNRMLGV